MDLREWRSGFKTWVQQLMVVDSWELRNPTIYGKLNAYLPPLQALDYSTDDLGTCSAIQDLYLTLRYRGDARYEELPLGSLEQLHLMLTRRLVTTWQDIADLSDLVPLAVNEALRVEEYGDGEEADWLVTLVFSMRLIWFATPSPLPGDSAEPAIDVKQIEVGLFTERLEPKDHSDPTRRDKYGQVTARTK
jgi:hypothetical protein